MFICLVRPPIITSSRTLSPDATPPLGVAYLAASVLEAGHRVVVVDGLGEGITRHAVVPDMPSMMHRGLDHEDVVARIPRDVDIIGVSCMFSLEWPYTRKLIDLIAERFPDVPIIVGGEHITGVPTYVLQDCAAISVCVLGEGEETIVDLLDTYERGGDLDAVNGIAYRKADEVVLTPPRKRIREVENIAEPAWHLIPIDRYLDNEIAYGLPMGRTMPILASRGCPYDCTFCSSPAMWGRMWRIRPPEQVLNEMMTYVDKYGVKNFEFYDLTAFIRKDWIVEMATLLIDSGLDVTWQLPSGTRSEAIDEEVSRLLYESGCRYMHYAPESGSVEILKRIRKKVSKKRMLQSMRSAAKSGLNIKANIIFGFPGETYRHVLDTYGFIVQMALAGIHGVSCFPFSPYPGSVLTTGLLEKGVVQLDDDYFNGLLITKLNHVTSYSESIPNRMLTLICLFGMALFYTANYATRPMRIYTSALNLVHGKPETRLETILLQRVFSHPDIG